jgi:hypothetical protein
MSKVLAICIECGRCKACGEECTGCKSSQNSNGQIIDYSQALKEAVVCWQNANCDEHLVPCKATLKEFAEKFVTFQKRIDVLESAIRSHKELKKTSDDLDVNLWQILN